jgi:hypothetical protein
VADTEGPCLRRLVETRANFRRGACGEDRRNGTPAGICAGEGRDQAEDDVEFQRLPVDVILRRRRG